MYVAALGLLANVGFHHLTMAVLGMGVYGAGLALSLTGMFLLAALIAVTWFFRCVRMCGRRCCLHHASKPVEVGRCHVLAPVLSGVRATPMGRRLGERR